MDTDYRFDRSSICEILEHRFSSLSRLKHELRFVQVCVWGTLLVAQLVEALYYKPEGRGFDSRWCQ